MATIDPNLLLSVKDLVVKFRVRGRILTAIRGISLDIYKDESIAIVGESGSGKSVFTKTFAGMLDSNGFIDQGKIVYRDPELQSTDVTVGPRRKRMLNITIKQLNRYAQYGLGSDLYLEMKALKDEHKKKMSISGEDEERLSKVIADLEYKKTEAFNHKQTLDPKKEKDAIKKDAAFMKECQIKIDEAKKERAAIIKKNKLATLNDKAYMDAYHAKLAELKAAYDEKIKGQISEETKKANEIFAKEFLLSVGRYDVMHRNLYIARLIRVFRKAYIEGVDLSKTRNKNALFEKVVFRVKLIEDKGDTLHGDALLDLSKVKYTKDWQQIRGTRISTVFQDPMTSLNPIIPIGKQISSIIIKHQHVSEAEARKRAIDLMKKVGIPNAENRYEDYPFQYSGGMRQRIVIAIALSCQPKILICDEPTTALDVTIQAQILRLIKSLQKEFHYTIVFITHDLGVVANIADRVAVLYAGQIVELGTVEDIFFDPRHPYTWALLSSMPQLAERNTTLYSISGTPPSLYNKIVGDPFAPRNEYCMKIDTLMDPPMFKVSDTHYAKTWLLDPRSPKVEKPEQIKNIHEKLIKTFNIDVGGAKHGRKEN